MNHLELSSTVAVVADCCEAAERAVRQQIENKHHAADEEFITRLWHGEFKFELRNATKKGQVACAFRQDLTTAYGSVLDRSTLDELSADIFADSRLHKRSLEARTGGDFGILLVRPAVHFTGRYLVFEMTKQGLLCQAKLRHQKRWGSLSANQLKVLKDRTEYLSLVLYSYSDTERKNLKEVLWQPAQNATINEVVKWLKKDAFPHPLPSRNILELLACAKLGTNNMEVINNHIACSSVPAIEIMIDWPDDRRPPEEVAFEENHQTETIILSQY